MSIMSYVHICVFVCFCSCTVVKIVLCRSHCQAIWVSLSGFLQRCLAIQVLVILEQGPHLELQGVAIQALELLGAILDSLEEDTPGSNPDKELLGEDTQGLAHLAPLVPLVDTQDKVLQVEDIQALVPLEAVTLVQEGLHQELPKVAILEALQGVLQVATQEVHLEAIQVSKVPILEQQHLRLLTLRLYLT